jgi:hypothetical protein
MLCYSCFEQGTERPTVALHHDTWTATERPRRAEPSSRR